MNFSMPTSEEVSCRVSGESKPSIRGLGFNRMAVTENGIKHEGQQWGEDHGLEINQFDVDRVEIVKGPSALLYGSDAIGGVINLFSDRVPDRPARHTSSRAATTPRSARRFNLAARCGTASTGRQP